MSEAKSCSACGARFACGRNDAECWCAALPPLPAAALNGEQDCYCPRCLASTLAAQRDEPLPSPASQD